MNDENSFDMQDLIEQELDEIRAKKPSERTLEDWLFLVEYDLSVMEDRLFPYDRMSAEDWKGIILAEPIVLQYNPPVDALLKILKKEDFEVWDSYRICQALLFEGDWLAEENLLPLEKITQEDFDFSFGAIPFPTAEEFWDVAPGYFPKGFPPHIRLPFPKPDDEAGKKYPMTYPVLRSDKGEKRQ